MPTQIVLSVSGGCLQDVFSSDPDVEVVLVDWDTEGRSADEDPIVEITADGKYPALAVVVDFPVAAIADLAGTDEERAIEAAIQRGILNDAAV
jgi:hypothetical protein